MEKINMGFKELFNELSQEKEKTYKKRVGYNPNYDNIIHKKMTFDINSHIQNDGIILKSSVGITNYAHIPWICLLSSNPSISRSAKKGIYIVILFNKTGDSLYIALSQGFTHFKEMQISNTEQNELISMSVSYFQQELKGEIIDRHHFSFAPIDLGDFVGPLGNGYIKTTILSKRFSNINFDEGDFYRSLSALISEYEDIIMHFGNRSYDEVIDIITNRTDIESIDRALENLEKEIKDNFVEYRDVKHKPIYVNKGDLRTNKFLKITQGRIRKKVDYLKLARDNYQTGIIGEKLALVIERDRLIDMGIDPDQYVKRVSVESDSFGYDIESVDIRNGRLEPIYIEVKATKVMTDISFFVSKNELEVSRQKNESYRVIRIFDITSIAPKYYFADGHIEENFYLDPVTYSAIYKFEVKK
jgi:hypothetical protein